MNQVTAYGRPDIDVASTSRTDLSGAMPACFPADETSRLAALDDLHILDSPQEKLFDDLARLASQLCQTSIALVSLVDRERQWFKAQVGLDAVETSRDVAFCAHAILEPDHVFEVPDAALDERFASNPLVVGPPNIRFYAGAPIVTDDGYALGTICVIDTVPKKLTSAQAACLQSLARQASALLTLRKQSIAAANLAIAQAGLTAEAKLKQEKGAELLELVLQGRGLGLWDMDISTGQWTTNARELQMLGYPADMANSSRIDWRQLIHPEDRAAAKDAMVPHLRGENPYYECTHRLRHYEGHWIWVLNRAVIVKRDEFGAPLRIVGTHMDVTERRRIEDERQQNAERLELAMDGGNIALWDLHVPTGKVVYNEQWASMVGYTLAEVDARPELSTEVVHPEDLPRLKKLMTAHIKGKAPRLAGEGRMRHKDGHWVWVMMRAKVSERDANGRAVRVVGINVNITERKTAEAALHDEAQLRRLFLDQAQEYVFVLREGMRLKEFNPSFAEALGYSPKEVVDLRPWNWDATYDTRSKFRDRFPAMLTEPWTEEMRWRRKDGVIIDVEMSCTPVVFKGVRELLFVCRDVTEAKNNRLALEQAKRSLEETAQLARVGGWELDLINSELTWSAEVYRIHELDQSIPATLENAIAYYAPEARPVITAAVEGAIKNAATWDLELPLLTARGRRIWVRAQGRAIREGRVVTRLVGAFQDITHRKNAEEALKHSEQRLTLALESSRQSIFDWDVQSDNVHLSSHLSIARGGPDVAENMRLESFLEMVHPDDRLSLVDTLAAAAKGLRASYEHEHRISKLGGGWIWIRSVGRVSQHSRSGLATRLSAVDEDVTSRKAAEQALIESERRLRLITDNVPALVTHIDRHERYTFANAQVETTFGVPRQAILGRTMRDVRGDVLYNEIAPHISTALLGERAQFSGASRVGDRLYHYQSHYIPDMDANGFVTGFYAVTFDITDLKEAEMRAIDSENRLRGIADNLPALIAEVGRDGTFRFANENYSRWLGLDHREMVGQPVEMAIGASYYSDRGAQIRLALSGQRVTFESSITMPLGQRTLQSTYLPHFDARGDVAGFYALTSDITELKATQKQLLELSRVDTLTRIPNRRHFQEHFDEALLRARRTGKGGALFYVDVDNFKSVNDTLGHAAGDEVLKHFAQRLQAAFRKTDFVARYAGDEFVVIAEGVTDETAAHILAGNIVAALRTPFELASSSLPVTSSIGVTIFNGAEKPEALLARADAALYAAKQNGRNNAQLANIEGAAEIDRAFDRFKRR